MATPSTDKDAGIYRVYGEEAEKAARLTTELTAGELGPDRWDRLKDLPVDQARALGALFQLRKCLADPDDDIPFTGNWVWNPDSDPEPPAWLVEPGGSDPPVPPEGD